MLPGSSTNERQGRRNTATVSPMQVRCDHCGNTLFGARSQDTGLVDETLKGLGVRWSDGEPGSRYLRDAETDVEVTQELRELGFNVSHSKVSHLLAKVADEVVTIAGWRASGPEQEPPRPPLRDVDVDIAVAEELRELGMEVGDHEVSGWLNGDEADTGQAGRGAPRRIDALAAWLERQESSLAPINRETFDRLTTYSNVRDDINWERTPEGLLACSAHCYEQLSMCSACDMRGTADEHRGCPRYVARCTAHGAQMLPFPRQP